MQEHYQASPSKTQKRLCCFIAGLLLLQIVISMINTASQLLPIPTAPLTTAYYGALWLLAISALPSTKSVWPRFLIVYCFFIFVGMIGIAYNPGSRRYVYGTSFDAITKFQTDALLSTSPFILVGMAVSDYKKLIRILHKAARVGVILGALVYLFSILSGRLNHYDDMNYAYGMCTFLCILIADTHRHDIWYAIVGAVCMIIAGTRGPIVCCLLAVIIKALFVRKNVKNILVNIFGFGLCAVAVQLNALYHIINAVSNILKRFGIEQIRLMEYVNNGMLMDSSGRDDFASLIWQAIRKKPILGYGLGSDRYYLGGSYVHNLFLELLLSFGIVGGGIVIIWFLFKCICALRGSDPDRAKVVLAFFCFGFLKLMFSSSMLYSKELFIMIGILLATPIPSVKPPPKQKVQST